MEAVRFWLNFLAYFKKQISLALFGLLALFSIFHWRHKTESREPAAVAKPMDKAPEPNPSAE